MNELMLRHRPDNPQVTGLSPEWCIHAHALPPFVFKLTIELDITELDASKWLNQGIDHPGVFPLFLTPYRDSLKRVP